MAATYWHKQVADKPLFPDLLWSRPENRQHAGKLLIIGGNEHAFAAPAEAYAAAYAAGAGTIHILLPVSIKRIAGALLPDVEYGASTPSGSFAKSSLGEWLGQAVWSDGTLLAGDLGHNSETAIVMENFLTKHTGPVTITKDAANYCLALPELVLQRHDTLLVITMAQLQKLATGIKYETAFTLGMDLLRLIENLHDFTLRHTAHIVVKHLDQLVVAANGQISTTYLQKEMPMWRIQTAASAAVWWLQNPTQPFESLSTAVLESSAS